MGLDQHARTANAFIAPALLTVPEAMSALRLSRATVYDLIRSGELGSVRSAAAGGSRRRPSPDLSPT